MSRVLKGADRRKFVDQAAYAYASFEIEYENRPAAMADARISPLDRRFVVSHAIHYGYVDPRYESRVLGINVSEQLVNEVRRKLPYWRRLLAEEREEQQ